MARACDWHATDCDDDRTGPVLALYARRRGLMTCNWRTRCNRTTVVIVVWPQPMRAHHNDVTAKIAFFQSPEEVLVTVPSILRGAAPGRAGHTHALSTDLTRFCKGKRGSLHKCIFFCLLCTCVYNFFFFFFRSGFCHYKILVN